MQQKEIEELPEHDYEESILMDMKSKLKVFDLGSLGQAVCKNKVTESPCLLKFMTP